jgi:tetratricopeptide (TPR) repeat protein
MILNYEEASKEFKAAILIDTKNANAHFQLASILLAEKRNAQALEESKRAFELDPQNDYYCKFVIELYKNQKQFEEAIKVCNIAYKNSKDSHYLYELSGLYILIGKTNKAISTLDLIEKKQGVSEQLIRQKENLYLSKNDLSGAIKEIEKLCLLFPENIQYKGFLADLLMGSKRQAEGLAIYKEIQKNDSSNGFAAFSLADYYRSKNDTLQYWMQLKMGIGSSIDYKLKTQVVSKFITEAYFGESHRVHCTELLDIFALSNSTISEPFLLMGDLALQDRNLALARSHYLEASSKSNSALMIWDQIIFCDQQLQRNDWMKIDGLKMIELFPNSSNGYLFYSIACRQFKEYENAFQAAQRGLEFADNENSLVQMLSNLGDIAHYAGKTDISDSAFEAVLSIDPTNSMVLNNYAYFLSLRKVELDKAENMSKRSIELDPQNASNLDTYGWILYQKKDFLNAKIQIKKSLEIFPNNAEVLEHLGDINFRLNETNEAIENWKKAQLLDSNNKALELKIERKKLP